MSSESKGLNSHDGEDGDKTIVQQGGQREIPTEAENAAPTNGQKPEGENSQIIPSLTSEPPKKVTKKSSKKQVISCRACDEPDNIDMVQCDRCNMWYHFVCVGVDNTISELPWECAACKRFLIQRVSQSVMDTPHPKSRLFQGGKSVVSSRKSVDVDEIRLMFEEQQMLLSQTERRKQLERDKLARQLKEREAAEKLEQEIQKEKLMLQQRRFEAKQSTNGSCRSSYVGSVNIQRTQRWVKNQKDNLRPIKGCDFLDDTKLMPTINHPVEVSTRLRPGDNKLVIPDVNVNMCGYIPPVKVLPPFNVPPPINVSPPVNVFPPVKYVPQYNATPNSDHPTNVPPINAPPPPPMISAKFSNAFPRLGYLRALTEDQIVARLEKEALPTFSGSPEEWPIFIATYNRTTSNCNYTDDENLGRLIKALTGNARKLVIGRLRLPSAVGSVIETLKRNYGRPDIILGEIVAKIKKYPNITGQRIDLILEFSAMVEDLHSMLQETNEDTYLNDHTLLQMLVEKLPLALQLSWADCRHEYVESKRKVNLIVFNNWLIGKSSAISYLPKSDSTKRQENKGAKPKSNIGNHIAVHTTDTTNPPVATSSNGHNNKFEKSNCRVCDSEVHSLEKCTKFLNLSRNDRYVILKKYNLCRVCLARHGYRCPKFKQCGVDKCTRYHHALLHNSFGDSSNPKQMAENKDPKVDAAEKVQAHHHHYGNSTLYRIVPVYLYGSDKKLKTYAFIDEGSSMSLIEEDIVDQLQLDGPSTNLCLKWTNDVSRLEENSRVVSIQISGVQENDKMYRIRKIHTVKQLGLPNQTINEESISKFDHLKHLPIAFFENQKPTMLIGLDNYRLVMSLQTKSGKWDEPIAAKTNLGWTVYGTHRGRVQENQLNFHLCECSETTNDLQSMVENFWSLDSFGVGPCKVLESADDVRAKNIMERTTRLVNGSYETGLLWRRDNIKFPNSREMAIKRLICFENKLLRDPELQTIINEKILDHLKKGYVYKLSGDEMRVGPKTWYLPIFSVQNPNKPGKVRVVWDAAAKAFGVSLNDFLLKGPDNLTPLIDVLCKFREQHYAISGDITEMYHRVRVIQEDVDAQRFLWRNCDRGREPEEYVMRVMTFGATCSPSLAQHVKNLNAAKYSHEHPRAVEAITCRHYVDDWLDSFVTRQEAIDVIQQVIKIHEAAGFHIRGWRSNDPEILRSIGQTTSSDLKSISGSDVVTEKVLGMWWQTDVDAFVFRINRSRIDTELMNGSKIPTKRQVLSIIMSTFDPLGLLSPIITHGKVIVQEVWKSGVDWDEKICDNQLSKWVNWAARLQSIENIRIPRRYFVTTSNNNDSTFDLHVFCDAGGDAYAACAYVLNTYHGHVEVSLVASKTRVNPKRVLSVPRLELLAAVLAVRLMNLVKSSHSIVFRSQTIWSDSTTVLSWIKSDARRYKQFVALRIGECLESTDIHQWRYVPTKQNIADMSTKWPVDIQRLSTEWIFGPKFLHEDKSKWPEHPKFENAEPEDELLQRLMFVASTTMNIVTPNLENFSTWGRMVRSQAFFNRAVQNFKCKRQQYQKGPLTVKDVRNAEILLYKKAQWDAYKKEVTMLSSNSESYVEKTSDLYSYSPYIDDEGVLRVRGRIEKARNIPFSAKRPVILPRNHIVTRRILECYHKAFLHQNHSCVINEVRQKYTIPKLRVLYAQVRAQCQYCKVRDCVPNPPEMAVLPKARLEMYVRPFYHTGIDLFGPFEVSIGRRTEKRWCSLFTCMSIRAIHLELVNSLTTESCIRSLSMFVARRGMPHKIFTDNGTNFHGANNQLIAEFAKSSQNCSNLANIEWNFIPPGSPHFGGSWERLIRIVKTNLMTMFTERRPSEEVLRACLCEVENLVNTRPLTFISLDSEDAEALTPNHFIHGTSNGYKPLCEIDGVREPTYKDWRYIQWVANHFWRRFTKEYLPEITRRTKWYASVPSLKIGDLVLIIDERNTRGTWPRGRVMDVTRGEDQVVRSATVQTASGLYTRPVVKLAKLDVEENDQRTKGSFDKGDNVRIRRQKDGTTD